MPRHRDFAELRDLLAEVQKIPLDEIIDVPYDLDEDQHVYATVRHADIKRLYTAQARRVRRAHELRAQLVEDLASEPGTVRALMEQIERVAHEADLLQQLFFYLLLQRHTPPAGEMIGVARGWQIYWEESEPNKKLIKLLANPDLDDPDGTEDPD